MASRGKSMATPKITRKKPTKTVRTRTAKTIARRPKIVARKSGRMVKPISHTPIVSTNGKTAHKAQTQSLPSQKETLQQERQQVEAELNRLRAELQQAPEMTGDEVDLNVYERERTLSLVSTYERRLEEIDAALRAAAQGKYGICERCGNPIPPERLEIFPEARLCVSCKNELEKEQRRLRM